MQWIENPNFFPHLLRNFTENFRQFLQRNPRTESNDLLMPTTTYTHINPVPVFSDVMVATVATSDCIVRPAASQVFLPIMDCWAQAASQPGPTSCLPRSPRCTDENETRHRAVAHLGGWENWYFERCSFLSMLSGP